MTWAPWEQTLILAMACAVIELVTVSFLFLAFALGLLPVALLQLATGELSLTRDALVFAVSALTALVLLRRFARRHGDTRAAEDDVNQY